MDDLYKPGKATETLQTLVACRLEIQGDQRGGVDTCRHLQHSRSLKPRAPLMAGAGTAGRASSILNGPAVR